MFPICNHHNCLSLIFPLHLNTYVMALRHYKYFFCFSAGIVFIRQNLTSSDVRFWRINTVPALKGLNIYTITCYSRTRTRIHIDALILKIRMFL